jgi:hypothetical protein
LCYSSLVEDSYFFTRPILTHSGLSDRDVGEAASALAGQGGGGSSDGMEEMLEELSSLIAGLREWRSSVAASDEKEGGADMIAAWLEVYSAMQCPPTT